MVWYVAVKDIISFYKTQKNVFIWLIISMIVCSFVINYSYSFARYRGNLYDENMGENQPLYKIYSSDDMDVDTYNNIISDLKKKDIPNVSSVACMTKTKNGIRIAGSTDLSPGNFKLTGAWVEGYAIEKNSEKQKICVVNEKLLSYKDKLKMTGETYSIDDEDFVIEGVYETLVSSVDIVIYLDKYMKKYGCFDELWLTFEEKLDSKQQHMVETVINNRIKNARIESPVESSEEAQAITVSNQMQYSLFIILLVVFLASIIQYWYEVNISTYTIYWMTGAPIRKILGLVLGENFILCVCSYLAGLLLNILFGQFITQSARLTVNDMALGFGIFFGTMLILGLINMLRISRTFSVNSIRRE